MTNRITRSLAGTFILTFLITLLVTFLASFVPVQAQDAVTAAGVTAIAPDRLIVRYKSGSAQISAASAALNTAPLHTAALEAVQVVDSLESIGTQILQVPPHRLNEVYAALQQDPNVESVAYDVLTAPAAIPNDPALMAGTQWAPQRLQAPEAWDITTGQDVVIAVVDSGVDPNHPDLRDRLIPGYNIYNNNTNTSDGCGHGTHLAGIAAATGNNAQGIAGIAYSARIMPVKVMNDTCSGSYSRLIQGIFYAVDNGARVIVISSGATVESVYLRDALIYARQRGVVVAAAAGNNNNAVPFYPAAYPEAICVAGSDANDNRYTSSNYGSHVDIAAPASSVHSTYWNSASGSTYANMSGTSMAAPHVAGVAALLLARNPALTVGEIETILSSTADDRDAPGWDPYFGAGRVNAWRAVEAAGATLPAPTATPTAIPPTPTPTVTPTPTAELPTPTPTATPAPTDVPPTEVPPTEVPPTPTGEPPAPTVVPTLPSPTVQTPNVHVEELAIRYVSRWPRWMAIATVKVADQAGQTIEGANVQMTWGESYVATVTCTTNRAGTCSVASASLRQHTTALALSVDTIQHLTLPYDPAANRVALPLSGLLPPRPTAGATLTAQRSTQAVLVSWSLATVDPARDLVLFRAAGDDPDSAQPVEIAPISGQGWQAHTSYDHTDTQVLPNVAYSYWLVQFENGEPADELGHIEVPVEFTPTRQLFVPLISN
jgi:thermitase